MQNNIINDANHISIQRLLSKHLADVPHHYTAIYEGVTIHVEPSRHRTGVPNDAISTRYVCTHLGEGWSIRVRAVWSNGELLAPTATHTVIENYFDNHARYGTYEPGVAVQVNTWLRGLRL